MNGPEFWSRVDQSAGPGACWPWTGSRNVRRRGYGQVRFGNNVPEGAHRVAYKLAVGPIPEGMTIDHVRARGCVTTACCNPAHLEAVTLAENIARTALSACGNGHPKTPQHGRPRGTKWRCVTCEVQTQRDRRARKAVA